MSRDHANPAGGPGTPCTGAPPHVPARAAERAGHPRITPEHGKLQHRTPGWVPSGARFHVRLRIAAESGAKLTDPDVARKLLESAAFYHHNGLWYAWLVLLMPDHLHAIITFPPGTAMSRTVGEWKKYHVRTLGLLWQDNYFDHRLRNDDAFVEKAHYIRMNPVRAGLCDMPEDWPWLTEPWRDRGGPGAPRTGSALQNPARAAERAGHPAQPALHHSDGGPGTPREGALPPTGAHARRTRGGTRESGA